jgi:sulfonate transport system substrate-binding protein
MSVLKSALRAIALLLLFVVVHGVQAGDLPTVVRVAAVSSTSPNGELLIGGVQSSAIVVKGWLEEDLKKLGVKLEWVPIPTAVGGPAFNEGLANKTIDFAVYGDFPAIIGKAGGIDTRLIVPAGRGNNSYLVTRVGLEAKSILDLRGKRIAVQKGRPHELAFSQLLYANGLRYSDFKIFNMNSQAAGAALAAGSVDAIFTNSEAITLSDKGVGKIIWDTKATNWQWRSEVFVREDFARQYPAITQAVATAYVKAAYWSAQEQNRAEVIHYTARNGTPEKVIERDYADDGVSWKDRWSPLFDAYMQQHYRDAIRFARSENLIRRDIDVNAWFDPRYVDAALKELKLENFWVQRKPTERKPGA